MIDMLILSVIARTVELLLLDWICCIQLLLQVRWYLAFNPEQIENRVRVIHVHKRLRFERALLIVLHVILAITEVHDTYAGTVCTLTGNGRDRVHADLVLQFEEPTSAASG